MIKYVVEADGSILFEQPFTFVSNSYAPDPINPCRYIPKYDPCEFRRLELQILSCGNKNVRWACNLFNKTISVPECRACKIKTTQSLNRT